MKSKIYEAPALELVTLQVERGFAASDDFTGTTPHYFEPASESYEE